MAVFYILLLFFGAVFWGIIDTPNNKLNFAFFKRISYFLCSNATGVHLFTHKNTVTKSIKL